MKIKIKCQKLKKDFLKSNDNILEYTCELPKIDSYCVTVVSDRKSWGTISCIKHFWSYLKCLMQ